MKNFYEYLERVKTERMLYSLVESVEDREALEALLEDYKVKYNPNDEKLVIEPSNNSSSSSSSMEWAKGEKEFKVWISNFKALWPKGDNKSFSVKPEDYKDINSIKFEEALAKLKPEDQKEIKLKLQDTKQDSNVITKKIEIPISKNEKFNFKAFVDKIKDIIKKDNIHANPVKSGEWMHELLAGDGTFDMKEKNTGKSIELVPA
jgi:hypothetical protein